MRAALMTLRELAVVIVSPCEALSRLREPREAAVDELTTVIADIRDGREADRRRAERRKGVRAVR